MLDVTTIIVKFLQSISMKVSTMYLIEIENQYRVHQNFNYRTPQEFN